MTGKPKITEAQFQRQVIALAKLYGWRVAHFRPAQNARGDWRTPVAADGKGFPDLVLVRDKVLFVELKTSTGKLTRDHAEREISKLATQIEIAIRQHGRIQTPAFTTMNPEKLLQAIDWYEQQLDEMWPAYRDGWQTTADEHATVLAKWTRLNTLLWEAKLAADIPTVTHQVLTGQSLASRLADALKGATA